jgi:PKHD-type hydroxylase
MNYRDRYVTVDLDDEEFNAISTFLAQQKNFEQTEIEGVRTCDVCFVDDSDLNEVVRQWVTKVNEAALWDFNIDYLEPLQLTRYKEGDKYDWHQDESEWHKDKREEGRIRKISFTLLLNDDYEGGEFSLINQTIPLKAGQMIFFHSDDYHAVAPVKSGERLSLVGWIQGQPWS